MPSVENYEIVFIVAVCLTLISTPIAASILRKSGYLDNPNPRSSHVVPTPRGAGMAQLVGVAGSLAVAGGIPVSGMLAIAGYSILGAVDDFKPRPPTVRLFLQVLIGLATVLFAFTSQNSFSWHPIFLSFVGILILVGMVNASNFMDGINGISLAHGVIFGFVYSVILWQASVADWVPLGAVLAGISIAVLPWNWGKSARVFLGDSGSYLLGASVALLILATGLLGPGFLVALAPVTIYLIDTCSTVLRRAWRRESLTIAHRDHVYQQLIRCGWTHARTATYVATFSLLASLIGLGLQKWSIPVPTGILLLIGLSVLYLSSPHVVKRCSN